MSDPLASYAFLPWLRRGMASRITRDDDDGVGAAAVPRAELTVGITFNDDPAYSASVDLALNGPGEVGGLDADTVVRVVPGRDVHDAEPNYFPFLEFDQADLPWRYTPSRASGDERLTPWFCLLCLSEGEIADYQAAASDASLATVTVAGASALPKWSQLWAWAHTQVSGAEEVSESEAADILATEPERMVSRVMSPRRLDAKTAYRALLVPTFERGRLAGLGDEVSDGVDALEPAWNDQTASVRLPVYYEWSFQTGVEEDFESLARKLVPFTAPKEVGVRDLDVSTPGMGLPAAAADPLGLEGALKTAETEGPEWTEEERTPFVAALSTLLNLPAEVLETTGTTPVVAPPLYGRWHAGRDRLTETDPPAWFRELNADPRLRVPAGLGTQVVQAQQQALMASAWAQVGQVREINARLRQQQLARLGAQRVHERHVVQSPVEEALFMAGPVLTRVRASPRTIAAALRSSPVADGVMEAQMRRLSRPLGPIGRRQGRNLNLRPSYLLRRLNRGDLTPAPAPDVPSGMFTSERGGNVLPRWASARVIALLRMLPRLLLLLLLALVLLALIAMLTGAAILAGVAGVLAIAALAGCVRAARRWRGLRVRIAIRDGTVSPTDVRTAPPRPGFVAVEVPILPGRPPIPPAPPAAPSTPPGGDSPSASAFRAAATVMLARSSAPVRPGPVLEPVSVPALRHSLVRALDPDLTFASSIRGRLSTAPGLTWRPADPLQEVMAAPEFPQPMYEPLRDLGQDWLLPGLELVPQNSTCLLVTNQQFVEGYMLGLSHEMARELLWNEYPTDQLGTYFRQFWDVRGYVPPAGTTLDPETLKDVDPIHTWSTTAPLGSNSSRATPPGGEHLVLLVRGELLRRYPNTMVYAVRAERSGQQRVLGTEERHPVFRGMLKPDVTFFGFELTATDARGSTSITGDPGWFFVLQEQPSEPRFGLDLATRYGGRPDSWNALSWGHLAADEAAHDAITYIDLATRLPDTSRAEQDTPGIAWHEADGTRASDLAYITLQLPVRVAIHGSRMLPS